MTGASPWSTAVAESLISSELNRAKAFYGDDGDGATALLPILHALQATFGCVSPDAVPLIAKTLNVSHAEVRGVVSFYHDFHDAPIGRHHLKICRAEACQAMGSERVAVHLAQRYDLRPGTTMNGVTLHDVYCLGNCALGPAALCGDELLAGFDVTAADALLARLADTAE